MGVGQRVARLLAGGRELAGEVLDQPEREVEPHAVGRRLSGEVAERDVEAAARLLLGAEPHLRVGDPHGQRVPLLRVGRVGERAQQRLPRARPVARRALRLGERDLDRRAALPRRRTVGEHAQRRLVEPRRRRRRRSLELPCRALQHVERPLVAELRGVFHVMGARDQPGAAPLECGGGARVGGQPPAAGRALVDGVAHDRVPEREPARPVCRPHERAGQQLVERAERVGLGDAGGLSGERRLERIAGHRRALEQQPRLVRQGGQLGAQRQRQRLGDARRPRELLEVERVAAAQRVDRRRVGADQLPRLGLAERRERQGGDASLAARRGQRRVDGRRPATLPSGDREQHGAARRTAHQRGQRVDRRAVRPLHVVEPEHERAGARQPLEEVAQRPVHAVAVGRSALAEQRKRLRIGEAEPREPPVVEPAQVRIDRLGPHRIRQVLLELRGRRAEHEAVVRRRAQLGEQPRLSDARLARDRHDAAGAGPQAGERAVERLDLARAADQTGHRGDSP